MMMLAHRSTGTAEIRGRDVVVARGSFEGAHQAMALEAEQGVPLGSRHRWVVLEAEVVDRYLLAGRDGACGSHRQVRSSMAVGEHLGVGIATVVQQRVQIEQSRAG